MNKTKITKLENLCLKCEGGIIERIIKENNASTEVTINKCTNKNCNYKYGLKEFTKDYTIPKVDA